jgi:4-hydroxybenzoate polyprenyltransferase
MRAWGRLFRLSLAPSAAADIAAGVVVAARGWPSGLGVYVLMLASLCVYHGGMALNDWADRDADRRVRPDRPIPSGKVSASSALSISVALLVLGPLLAWSACTASGLVLGLVSIFAALYDTAGRGPRRGPILLAACRAGNLSTGIAYGLYLRDASPGSIPSSEAITLFGLPAIYAAYVFFVSRLGRLEDLERDEALGPAPALYLGGAATALLLLPVLALVRVASAGFSSRSETGVVVAGAGFVVVWGAAPLFVRAIRTRVWSKIDVLRAMGLALRRLLVFTAGAAVLSGAGPGWIVAAAILCGYPISYFLRGVFPPS